MVWEAGHRLALDIEAHDGAGSAPFLPTDLDKRDPSSLAGTNTIHTGGQRAAYLLLPSSPATLHVRGRADPRWGVAADEPRNPV